MTFSFRSLALAAVVLSSGCAARPVVKPDGVTIIRSYRFETTVADPQPAWNPTTYLVVARHQNGFALYQEGAGRQEFFAAEDNRQTYTPVWLNRDQFVFGGARNATRGADGRILNSTDGLTVVGVVDDGRRCSVTRAPLSNRGNRPRVAHEEVYAQTGRTMVVIDRFGAIRDAGEGFWAEPQAHGPGVAWQEAPVIEPDLWTAQSPRGRLVIRWKPGVVSFVPGGVQPRWTSAGGLVCSVVRADPPADRPWWTPGTDVVYLTGPDAEPVVIARDARDPAPHPTEPMVAVTARDGGVRLVAYDPQVPSRILVTQGRTPQWSHDGLRLLAEEPQPTRPEATVLRIQVLKLTPVVP